MKQMIKRLLAAGFAIAAMIGCIQGGVLNADAQNSVSETETMMMTQDFLPEQEEFPESEELFSGYVENLFYENSGDRATFANVADRILNTKEKQFFDELKGHISDVAEGKEASTKFVLDVEFTWTAKELGVEKVTYDNYSELISKKYNEDLNYTKIWNSLLMDCPYEMYWYDKTVSAGGFYYVRIAVDGSSLTAFNIHVDLPVASEYQNPNAEEPIYSFNTEMMERVLLAKNNAQSIVEANKGLSDYQKMLAYKDAICEMTSYNDSAADNMNTTSYGNPWQLIWAFDGDEETMVVCEGYAKSFQYLCDLSGLTCYSVSGNLSWGIGAGPHMWNIVTLDGSNYLVDVTNCDSGSVGYPDKLFLAGTDHGSVADGYTFNVSDGVSFVYDDDQILLLGEDVLRLAAENYSIKEPETTTPVTDIFDDVADTDWFADEVQYVFDKGIMTGVSDTIFEPGNPVTRATIVQTLYKLEGKPAVSDFEKYNSLNDTLDNIWWKNGLAWALNEGVAKGDSKNHVFNPDNEVTREDLATFIYRYAQYKGVNVELEGTVESVLGDTFVNSWAKTAFAWAVESGLIKGKTIGGVADLAPQVGATRAELATIMMRFYENNNLN